MGRPPEKTRGDARKTYPLRKKASVPREPEWTLRLEEWGAQRNRRYRIRSQEKKCPSTRNSQKRTTNETPEATPTAARDNTSMWGAARYQRKPQRNTVRIASYHRPEQTAEGLPRLERKCHSDIPIRDYVEWNKGESFHAQPIQIKKNANRLARIRNNVHTERRRRLAIRAKQGLTGTTTQTLGKRTTRRLEASLKKLQHAAGNNDVRPIWEFQSNLRMNKTENHVAIKKKDGAECQGIGGTLKRWGMGKRTP